MAPRGNAKQQKPAAPAKGAKAPAAPVQTVPIGASVGIDFGSATVTLAAFKGGAFEAIVNTDGERYTPLIAGFANEILLGAPAKSIQIRNVANTVSNVLHFLAKPFAEVTEDDKKMIYAEIAELEDGTVGFSVEFKGAKTIVSPSQIITDFSKQLLKYSQGYWDAPVTSAVLSIPYDFTTAQQQALVAAVEKAGFTVLGTVYDPLAAAVSFHLDQPTFNQINTYDNTPFSVTRVTADNVLVVDVGQNSIKTSVLSVQQGLMKNIATVAVKGGSSEIDKLLFKYFCDKFTEENDADLSESTRAVSRLKQAVEQVKRNIAQAPTAGVQLDGLYMGLDLFSDINRRAFDELTASFFANFSKQLADTFAQLEGKVAIRDISRIVLAGGSATLSNFQRAITKFFQDAVGSVPQVLKHVNICDTVAFGAAKLAATYAAELDQYTLEHPTCEQHKEIHANDILTSVAPKIETTTSSVGNSCVFTPYKHFTHLSLSKALYVKSFHGTYVSAVPMTSTAGSVQYVPFYIAHPKKTFEQLAADKTLVVTLVESAASIPEHVTVGNSKEVATLALNRADILAAAGAADAHVTAVVKFEINTKFVLEISVAYHIKGQQVPSWKVLTTIDLLAQKPLDSSNYSKILPALTLQEQEFDKKERYVARIQYLVAKYQQWRALPKHAKFITKNSQFMGGFVQDVDQYIAKNFNYIANVLPNPYNNTNLNTPLVIKGDEKIYDVVVLEKLLQDFATKLHDLLTFRKFTLQEAIQEVRKRSQQQSKSSMDDLDDEYDQDDEELLDDADEELGGDSDDDGIDLDMDFDALSLGDSDDDGVDMDLNFGDDSLD